MAEISFRFIILFLAMTHSKHWLHLNTEYYHVLKVWRIVISRGKEAS